MRKRDSYWRQVALAACVAALATAAPRAAQSVSGHARAVEATIATPLGVSTTRLADSGTLGGPTDARRASASTGSIPAVLAGKALHATTIGWDDQVASEASIGGLSINVAGNTISADFVSARAFAVAGAPGRGDVSIGGLAVNGIPIDVTGEPNQQIPLVAGTIVINEQSHSASGSVVNGLRIAINGVANVVIASAAADAQ